MKSIHQWISWSTWITKDPLNLVYPIYLSPPNSCYQRTSRNLIFTSYPNPAIWLIAFTKPHWLLLANPQNFPNFKTLFTLRLGVSCVVETYLGFSLWMSSLTFVGNEVYIVWFRVRKSHLKSSRQNVSRVPHEMVCLTKHSRKALSHLTLQLPAYASHMPFSCEPLLACFWRASHETALIFILCLILHHLNTKPNTIKSHKIQRTKLMQL